MADQDFAQLLPVPNSFLCPITQELMTDPVAAADGFVYERAAIQTWFQNPKSGGRSPMTNQPLPSKAVSDVVCLRRAIEEYLHHRPVLLRTEQSRASLEEAVRCLAEDLEFKVLCRRSQEEHKLKVQEQLLRLQAEVEELKELVTLLGCLIDQPEPTAEEVPGDVAPQQLPEMPREEQAPKALPAAAPKALQVAAEVPEKVRGGYVARALQVVARLWGGRGGEVATATAQVPKPLQPGSPPRVSGGDVATAEVPGEVGGGPKSDVVEEVMAELLEMMQPMMRVLDSPGTREILGGSDRVTVSLAKAREALKAVDTKKMSRREMVAFGHEEALKSLRTLPPSTSFGFVPEGGFWAPARILKSVRLALQSGEEGAERGMHLHALLELLYRQIELPEQEVEGAKVLHWLVKSSGEMRTRILCRKGLKTVVALLKRANAKCKAYAAACIGLFMTDSNCIENILYLDDFDRPGLLRETVPWLGELLISGSARGKEIAVQALWPLMLHPKIGYSAVFHGLSGDPQGLHESLCSLLQGSTEVQQLAIKLLRALSLTRNPETGQEQQPLLLFPESVVQPALAERLVRSDKLLEHADGWGTCLAELEGPRTQGSGCLLS